MVIPPDTQSRREMELNTYPQAPAALSPGKCSRYRKNRALCWPQSWSRHFAIKYVDT